ncbi:MAG TPA: serine hydrolase [Steroidobacteraceae bacterium]|jgi:CubicO group peptidase (beta-lactamase class C family)|nr:serine hydrolase [Steroidobacteraceae bacterium]
MKHRLTLISLALWLVASSALAAESSARQIDRLMRRSHELGIFNGVALVAEHDKAIYQASFGSADGAGKQALTPGYRFNIGSIAKEFSAVAIMQLVERGKLSLDDPLTKHLADLPAWAQKVTLRNLLEYTSGVADMQWTSVKSDADALADIKRLAAPDFEPGTRFAYTYNNVMLRQFVIAKVTGIPFAQYVRTFLYEPCGMRDSLVDPDARSRAIAHAFNDARQEDSFEMPVTGIVFVKARDLLKWNACLHGGKAISPKSLQILGHGFNPQNGGLGATGWEGDELLWHRHDGQSRNFEAWMLTDLKRETTIILVGNNKNQKLQSIVEATTNILAGKPWQQPRKSVRQVFQSQLDTLPIDAFIARYQEARRTRAAELDFDSESGLNEMAYSLMGKARMADAIRLFALNAALFPNSGNVYDSLAEAQLASGDQAKALINYQKALALDPTNKNAAEIVQRLKSESH